MLVTLVANLGLALSQWAIIAGLNRLGEVQLVGQYAYALGLAGVFLTAGQIGLRQFVMSQLPSDDELKQIFTARLLASVLSWLVLVVVGVLWIQSQYVWPLALLGLAKIVENLSDIAHGLYQRRHLAMAIAKSRLLRALLSPVVFLLLFWQSHNLLLACVGLLVSWSLAFVLCDLAALRMQGCSLTKTHLLPSIYARTYPLGLASLLVMLAVNLPLFLLAALLDEGAVGQYSSIFYFVTAGSLLLQSALQVVSPLLVAAIKSAAKHQVLRITKLSYVAAVGYGLLGIAGAALLGESVLIFAYGEGYTGLGQWMLLAAGLNLAIALQSVGGIVLTAYGVFRFQMWVMLGSVLVSALLGYGLIALLGVPGAFLAGIIVALMNASCFGIKAGITIKNDKV